LAQRVRQSGKKRLVLLVLSDFDPDGEGIVETLTASLRDEFYLDVTQVKVALTAEQAQYRWSGDMDTLNVYLEPGLVGRVAAEAFGLDPTKTTVPPLDGPDLPHLRAAMWALVAELTTGSAGGPLAAESLANVLAVQFIRHISAPHKPVRTREGKLPRARLRAVIEYIEEHLDAGPSLEQMASIAHISTYHFARQFKAATGLPPHQYVILRRVGRAKELLQAGTDLSLAEVAADAGFSDQSQFSHHFKRLVGVTPGRFRMSVRIE
jgi:AraC family transcriptional regulator